MNSELYNSFAEMAAGAKQKRIALQQNNKDRFNEVLKGQFEAFDAISKWPLVKSDIPGISGIRFYKVPEMGESLNVELYYHNKDKEKSVLGSVSKDGVLSIRLPKELQNIDRDELFKDILDTIDRLHPGVWVALSNDIILPDAGNATERDGGGGPTVPPIIDTRRLEFLSKQPDFLAGAVGLKKLDGYATVLYQHMIVWDNEKVGNAAFVKKLEKPIGAEEIESAKTVSGRQKLVELYIEPFIEHTRQELVHHGAERVVHLPNSAWVAQMTQKLNTFNPREDRAVYLTGERKVKNFS